MRKVLFGRILIVISLLLQFLNMFFGKYFSDTCLDVFRTIAFVLIAVGLGLVLNSYFSKSKSK